MIPRKITLFYSLRQGTALKGVLLEMEIRWEWRGDFSIDLKQQFNSSCRLSLRQMVHHSKTKSPTQLWSNFKAAPDINVCTMHMQVT